MQRAELGKACLQCGGKLDAKGYFYCIKDLIDMTETDVYDDSANKSWKRNLREDLLKKKITRECPRCNALMKPMVACEFRCPNCKGVLDCSDDQ